MVSYRLVNGKLDWPVETPPKKPKRKRVGSGGSLYSAFGSKRRNAGFRKSKLT
jgi:hypothetical protein